MQGGSQTGLGDAKRPKLDSASGDSPGPNVEEGGSVSPRIFAKPKPVTEKAKTHRGRPSTVTITQHLADEELPSGKTRSST